jgi:type II secretory pathway component PulK
LIVVLLIIAALSGIVLVLCRSARVEAMVSANHAAGAQAAAVQRGAEQYALAMIVQQADSLFDLDETYFAEVPVGEAGYFWFVRPDYGDPQLQVYGMIDEASKLNINAATADMLLNLGVPQDLAYSIVDWRDRDSTPGDDGAEDEYYTSLPGTPYNCKNAPFEALEELLLVRGGRPEVLYGLEAVEAQGYGGFASSARPGSSRGLGGSMTSSSSGLGGSALGDLIAARGLLDYLTVYGGAQQQTPEQNQGGQGQQSQLINLNNRDHRQRLRQSMRDFFGAARANQIMDLLPARDRVRDVFDFYFRTRLTAEEFDQIAPLVTTSDQAQEGGKVNINTAPREVLLALPGMTEETVTLLTSQRAGANTNRQSLSWVAEALGEKAIGLGDLITVRSTYYSVDIVAASRDGRAFRRARIVIDASDATNPRIIYRRDLTDRGWPLDSQILADLRQGAGLQAGGVPGLAGRSGALSSGPNGQ